MEAIVANVDHITFDIERALHMQLGCQPLPFIGMDKSGSAICTFFLSGTCSKGISCPFRHVRGERLVVCKHWLRGLCKKGDNCEFLHEYDMTKMPECYFYARFGECGNKECPFLHIDPEMKIKVCPWYDRGFCRHGANCKNRHVRKVMCLNYVCGFCLDGTNCKYVHPRFELPQEVQLGQAKKASFVCHFCNEVGHKAVACPQLIPSLKREHGINQTSSDGPQIKPINPSMKHDLRPIESVTCFKCGEKGHYANKCPKGHLAFLSHTGSHFSSHSQQNFNHNNPPPPPPHFQGMHPQPQTSQ